jgi:hypothetical protein
MLLVASGDPKMRHGHKGEKTITSRHLDVSHVCWFSPYLQFCSVFVLRASVVDLQ